MVDLRRDFWIRETGMGQQVAQLHYRYMMMMMVMMIQSTIFFEISCTFDVPQSVHHHTIQRNQPTRCNSFASLLLDVYVSLNMFQAASRPSSGAYNCTSSLWFYRWSVVVAVLVVVVSRLTSLLPSRSNGKPRGC